MKGRLFKTKRKAPERQISDELDTLQSGSWNLELLFSVVALILVDKGQGLLPDILLFAKNVFSWSMSYYYSTYFIALAAWSFSFGLNILMFSLITHVGLRGFWIALIGLRYVSGKVEVDSLNFSERFAGRARKSVDYDQYIERVEKICSVVYALIFLILFFLLSFLIYIVATSLAESIAEGIFGEDSTASLTIGMIIHLPFFLYFLDTLTLGGLQRLKRPKFVAVIFSPLHRVMQYVTLSILYRPLFHNFMNHKYSRRLAYSILPLLLLAGLTKTIVYQPSAFWPVYADLQMLKKDGMLLSKKAYDNERAADQSPAIIHFPSRYLDGEILELGILYSPEMDQTFEKLFPDLYKNGRDIGFKSIVSSLRENVEYLQFVNRFTAEFTIAVNDSLYTELEYIVHRNNDVKEVDFITAIDVSHLPYGIVHVKAEFPYFDESKDSLITETIDIPLIKR